MRKFLRSMRTAERLRGSPQLRQAMSCETPLVAALRSAILDRRHVIITGSAGGGKTHLLDQVIDELESEVIFCRIGDEDGARPADPHVLYHEDGTKLDSEVRGRLLANIGSGRLVIAINEGPLRGPAWLRATRPAGRVPISWRL